MISCDSDDLLGLHDGNRAADHIKYYGDKGVRRWA